MREITPCYIAVLHFGVGLLFYFPERSVCSNNLNQYAKRANETGNIYESDIRDLQERLEEIWTDMKEVLVRLSSIQ